MRNTKPHRRAFTLIELLVVISIFVLLLAIAVPAFSSMLYSSEQSLAESSVRIALNTARDVAARSPTGQDAAAVFTYEIESRKMSIVIVTQVGTFSDITQDPVAGRTPITRDVFAAAPGVEPLQMTSGWAVRGYAPANSIDNEWYESTYIGTQVRQRGNWVFPETSLNDETVSNSGNNRQTFMVRFEGGTGQVKTADPRAALVLSPSVFTNRRTWFPYPGVPNPWDAGDEADGTRFVRRILAWPTVTVTNGPPALSLAKKQQIIGAQCSDMILVKSVGQIAVCSENRLARALGVRTDPATGCLYQNPSTSTPAFQPAFLNGVQSARINAWIENNLIDQTTNDKIDSDARVFSVQRYLGWLQEVTGTASGEGVGS